MKILEIPHYQDDYECMWNGIEDLYIQDTGETLPPSLFFILSSFGSFCYMKTPKSDIKRMIALGDGRTKQMYQFLAPIVGFDYTHYSYSTYDKAIKKAKSEIDCGHPAILGALDMYYIPYFPSLYHQEHIPFHYVFMIDYDDDKNCIYVLDCGRQEIQEISYTDLQYAWDCSYPGLSKPYTICKVRMHASKCKEQIVSEALIKKGNMFLYPKVSFVGIKGFEKFIKDLPNLKIELSKKEYDKILLHMVTFLGTVPTVPNALQGIKEPDEIKYDGGFDKMARVLYDLGKEYKNDTWLKAAILFDQGAHVMETVKHIIVDYLIENEDKTDELAILFTRIKNIMIESYTMIIKTEKMSL